jgi:hypothetical protein
MRKKKKVSSSKVVKKKSPPRKANPACRKSRQQSHAVVAIVWLASLSLGAAWHRHDQTAFTELAKSVLPAAISALAFCLGRSKQN